jgi:hypothetical protein
LISAEAPSSGQGSSLKAVWWKDIPDSVKEGGGIGVAGLVIGLLTWGQSCTPTSRSDVGPQTCQIGNGPLGFTKEYDSFAATEGTHFENGLEWIGGNGVLFAIVGVAGSVVIRGLSKNATKPG